jgi:hypothetical protein
MALATSIRRCSLIDGDGPAIDVTTAIVADDDIDGRAR